MLPLLVTTPSEYINNSLFIGAYVKNSKVPTFHDTELNHSKQIVASDYACIMDTLAKDYKYIQDFLRHI
jgi:hypothetical protein